MSMIAFKGSESKSYVHIRLSVRTLPCSNYLRSGEGERGGGGGSILDIVDSYPVCRFSRRSTTHIPTHTLQNKSEQSMDHIDKQY